MALAQQTIGSALGAGTRNGVQALVIGGRIYLRSAGAIRIRAQTRSATIWGTSAYWSAQWSALTTEQRAAWTAYGLAFRQRPMKGWSGFTSGKQSFSGFNFANRWLGSATQINTPPALPCTMPDPVPRVAPFLVNSDDGYLFQLLDPVPDGFNVIVGAFAPTMTNSRPDLASCQRIATMPGPLDAGTHGPLLDDYEAAFGTTPAGAKEWYRFWLECENQTASMGDACGALIPEPIPPPPPPEGDGWVLMTQWQQGPALMVNDAQFNGQDVPDFNTEAGEGSGFEWHWPDSIPAQQALFTVLDIDSPTIPAGLLSGWHIFTPGAMIQDYSVTAIRMIVVDDEWVQDGVFNVEVAVIQDGFSWEFNF